MGVLGLIPPIALSITPVPITLQSLGVMLAGGLLGSRLGALSQLIFLLIVGVGAPLLAGGRGGFGVFVGPSAGYLLGYIVGAFVIGYLIERLREVSIIKVLCINIIGGIFVVYTFGITVQAFLMGVSVWETMKVSAVFLPGLHKSYYCSDSCNEITSFIETYYYACSKEWEIYKCGIRKRRNTFIACFFLVFCKERTSHMGITKEYKNMPLYNRIK